MRHRNPVFDAVSNEGRHHDHAKSKWHGMRALLTSSDATPRCTTSESESPALGYPLFIHTKTLVLHNTPCKKRRDRSKQDYDRQTIPPYSSQTMSPFVSLFLFVLIDVLGFSLVLPLFPYLRKDFSMSYTTLGYLQASNAVAQLFAVPVIGSFSDKFGRKPMLIVCVIGTLVSFVMLAMADSVWMLFASRILDGILGGNISLAQAYISGTHLEFCLFQRLVISFFRLANPLLPFLDKNRHDDGGRTYTRYGSPWSCFWPWFHRWTCRWWYIGIFSPLLALMDRCCALRGEFVVHHEIPSREP